MKNIPIAEAHNRLSALLKKLRKDQGETSFDTLADGHKTVENLNDSSLKDFSRKPTRKEGAKFRRHPFKHGNMTVALTNYMDGDGEAGAQWYAVLYFGAGKNFASFAITPKDFAFLDDFLQTKIEGGKEFQKQIKENLLLYVPDALTMQTMYEQNIKSSGSLAGPIQIVNALKDCIEEHHAATKTLTSFKLNGFTKQNMPVSQVMAAWSLAIITARANSVLAET